MHLFNPGLCINPVYCVHKIRFPAYSFTHQSVHALAVLPPAARINPGTSLIRTCSPYRHTSPDKPLYTLSRYFLPLCPVRGLRTASARLRHYLRTTCCQYESIKLICTHTMPFLPRYTEHTDRICICPDIVASFPD